jgi:hypothetical protein
MTKRKSPRNAGGEGGGQTNNPQLAGGEGQTETRRGGSTPRYDDAPEPSQSAEERATPAQPDQPQYDDRRNRSDRKRTDLPDFGDTEPGDPRRLDVQD